MRLLRRYTTGADYLDALVDQALRDSSLAPADRGLVRELTFGVVRWQATLDWMIAQRTTGRTQKPALQILLRLGLYQIFWLERIPDHAAVNETVEMAKRLGFGPQSGFINAVLRACLRDQAETRKTLERLKSSKPPLGYSHPEWLVERWQKRWGLEKTVRLLVWNNTPPPTYARLNALKTNPMALAAQWEREGLEFQHHQWSWTGPGLVYELKSHPSLATLPSFQQGLFYVQDPSTLLAVQLLEPHPGEVVLDLCAAPGGKAAFIAQKMGNQGRILAQDTSPRRLELVRQNCARLGLTGVEPALSSGSPPPVPLVDRVLVDAPCSNTGVMRRRVDVRWRLQPEEIARLARVQRALLEQAAARLKPAGTLVYSTCSLEPEENEEVVRGFLAAQPRFRLAEERTLRPFAEGVDGAYAARLIDAS